MTLSEMRRWLDARGIRLTKSLGQNFMHDGNQLRRLVAWAGVGEGDRVLEIGPGLGPLTELLLAQGGRVLAIEKDARLCACLRDRFLGEPRLELIEDDALQWLRETPRSWTGWKLVANLPYSVASPILVELALNPHPLDCMVVTLQLEVARRLAAQPASEDYGVLTLLVGLQFETRGWHKIPRDCFFPAPEVDSACVHLVRRERNLLSEEAIPVFQKVVKTAFSQRRKMLRNLFRSLDNESKVEAALGSAGISGAARAETLSLADFVALTEAFRSQALPPVKPES